MATKKLNFERLKNINKSNNTPIVNYTIKHESQQDKSYFYREEKTVEASDAVWTTRWG